MVSWDRRTIQIEVPRSRAGVRPIHVRFLSWGTDVMRHIASEDCGTFGGIDFERLDSGSVTVRTLSFFITPKARFYGVMTSRLPRRNSNAISTSLPTTRSV